MKCLNQYCDAEDIENDDNFCVILTNNMINL